MLRGLAPLAILLVSLGGCVSPPEAQVHADQPADQSSDQAPVPAVAYDEGSGEWTAAVGYPAARIVAGLGQHEHVVERGLANATRLDVRVTWSSTVPSRVAIYVLDRRGEGKEASLALGDVSTRELKLQWPVKNPGEHRVGVVPDGPAVGLRWTANITIHRHVAPSTHGTVSGPFLLECASI